MTLHGIIFESVEALEEDVAKRELASILMNCEKIGKQGYTKEDFLADCKHKKNEIVVNHSFDIK